MRVHAWGLSVGRPRGGCLEETIRSLFSVKGDEYSLSRNRFQMKQERSSWSLGLLYPHFGRRSFWLYLLFIGTVMAWEGMTFTALMSVWCIWGSSLDQLLHVGTRWFWPFCYLHCHSPHPARKNRLHGMCRMEAFSQM